MGQQGLMRGNEATYSITCSDFVDRLRVQNGWGIRSEQFGRESESKKNKETSSDNNDCKISSLLCRPPYYSMSSIAFNSHGPINSHFPLTPSSLHGLHIFLLPLGPTPNGNGPTLSLPPNPVDPPCLLDSASRRRRSSAVESVVAFWPGLLGPEPEGETRSE